MIPQISKALEKGFKPKQIIDYIIKKFPEHSGRIKDAMAAGFTIDQVLKFISGGKKALANIEKESQQAPTEFQQMRNRDIGRREEVDKRALQGTGLAASAILTPIASQAASSALSNALPRTLQNLSPSLVPSLGQAMSNPGMPQSQQSQSLTTTLPEEPLLQSAQQPPANNIAASIPEPANIEQDKGKSSIVDKLWSNFERGRDKGFDFESDAFLKIAKRMKSTGEIRSKEDFERFFNLFDQKKSEGKDLPAALREASAEYDTQKLSPTEQLTKNEEPQLQETKQLQEPIQEQEKPKIEKKSIVSSPNGIGEIKEIRNGQAIIDVDGKLHKVKEEDLEAPPLPEKDLADLHDDLLRGIESETGEDVSRMVQWAGYNPETNTLQFLPHTGKLYKYGNISPEDAALLTDILSVRKTSGANFMGAWKAGSKSPIGAALSKLIRKLQAERGGKGNEYEETHESIYSAYEPAINAKKKKKKK